MTFLFCTKHRTETVQKLSFLKQSKKEKLPPIWEEFACLFKLVLPERAAVKGPHSYFGDGVFECLHECSNLFKQKRVEVRARCISCAL